MIYLLFRHKSVSWFWCIFFKFASTLFSILICSLVYLLSFAVFVWHATNHSANINATTQESKEEIRNNVLVQFKIQIEKFLTDAAQPIRRCDCVCMDIYLHTHEMVILGMFQTQHAENAFSTILRGKLVDYLFCCAVRWSKIAPWLHRI